MNEAELLQIIAEQEQTIKNQAATIEKLAAENAMRAALIEAGKEQLK